MSNPRRANGHRRDQVTRKVLAEETHCALCGEWVDKTLRLLPGHHSPRCTNPECSGCKPHPKSPTVDEIVPVSLGGSPVDRANCRLAHRDCNIKRGNGKRGKRRTRGPLSTPRRWVLTPGGHPSPQRDSPLSA